MTEPKIEHRNEQPYVGIRAQVECNQLRLGSGLQFEFRIRWSI
jgi:hypothetical protein